MTLSNTPTPPNHITPAPSPGTGKFAVVRRARIEHLAAELLRAADAMQMPVPVEGLLHRPPLDLWPAMAMQVPENAVDTRWAVARLIAQKAGEAAWPARLKIFGERTFSASEVEMFAVALLLPTPLLNNLNAQQRTPETIARLFGVPRPIAARRLDELGYGRDSDSEHDAPDANPHAETLHDTPAVSSNDTTQ